MRDLNFNVIIRCYLPIHYFLSRKGHLDIVTYLITTCQVDVNAIDEDKWTPLHEACK